MPPVVSPVQGRWTIAVAGAAVVLLSAACASSDRQPSNRARSRVAASYVVTYRVVENGVRHWEVLSMRRPFRGSDLVYDTDDRPDARDRPVSGTIATETALYVVDAAGVHQVSGRQPGPASGDTYLTADVPELLRRKLATDTGIRRRVAGRQCRVYRFAEPPSGPIRRFGGGSDHDDVCLDADGLALASTWTYRGRVVAERTAVDVRTSGSAGGDATAPSVDDATPAGAAAATATTQAQPVSFLEPPPAPPGYRRAGLPVVFRVPDPQAPTSLLASSVVWAYADGPRFVTIEAGVERNGAVPWRAGDTVTRNVELRGLGAATTAVRAEGSEVRVDLSGGRWVRVRGSASVAELTSYAHRLRLRPGEHPPADRSRAER